MPPTTRSMTTRGVVAPNRYAVRQKKAKPIRAPHLTKHGQIGFDRNELQTSGALESDAAKPPTLANEVLEIFGKDRFVFDGNPPAEWDEAYENMKPAFSLVSRWMTEPNFQDFWDTLVHGQVEEVFNVHRQVKEIRIRINEEETKLFENAEVPRCFDLINHVFSFKPIGQKYWAETRSQSVLQDPNNLTYDIEFTSVTFLREDFLQLSYTYFPKATQSEQLRFLYFLAVTVAHEVAHLGWHFGMALRHNNEDDISPIVEWEPYFFLNDLHPQDFNHDELGTAWECFMFGGRIQPLNQSLSPFAPDGLAILPMNMVRVTPFWDTRCRIAPLQTAWISNQFSEAWWKRYGKRTKPGRPRLAPVRATVNRTIDSRVFKNNEYLLGPDAQRVAEHIVGGSPGLRFVRNIDDMWILTGVATNLYHFGESESSD